MGRGIALAFGEAGADGVLHRANSSCAALASRHQAAVRAAPEEGPLPAACVLHRPDRKTIEETAESP